MVNSIRPVDDDEEKEDKYFGELVKSLLVEIKVLIGEMEGKGRDENVRKVIDGEIEKCLGIL